MTQFGSVNDTTAATTSSNSSLLCRCVVIEDSVIGMQAAKAAGMRCIVTKSRYTEGESFDSADAIFDCIGDAGDERFSLDDVCTPGTRFISVSYHLQSSQ